MVRPRMHTWNRCKGPGQSRLQEDRAIPDQIIDNEFFARMDSEFAGWDDPVLRLGTALENDEFTLFCQPVRALKSGETFPFAEVLIRFREEESALLPPGEFFPIFEHYGMMPQLDRWVVRTAISRLARGVKLPCFSVNLASQTLEDPTFPGDVANLLSSAGVEGKALIFEIDESDTLLRPEAAEDFAREIRKVGAAILIDGFGQRSVSFNAIKTLRPDFVKVDGSIVRKILSNPSAETKLRAVLRVGEVIRMGVIAECVEEQDILARLVALGVGYAQGFGVYQPLPVDALSLG